MLTHVDMDRMCKLPTDSGLCWESIPSPTSHQHHNETTLRQDYDTALQASHNLLEILTKLYAHILDYGGPVAIMAARWRNG